MTRSPSAIIIAALLTMAAIAAKSQTPEAISAPGEDLIMTAHAEGAQIYECKPDAAGRLTWQFREPVASLFVDGVTIGRHYAGPSWELSDGGLVTGKAVARAPGVTLNDIPLLKLEATVQRAAGKLARTISVLRLNTKGGVMEGACEKPGAMTSAPYAADYAFYAKRS
ncbi:DUF3455 domain-containing protein [Terrarubrum flagellatum]|uniref:DUF3455 domain-containing protein n=1 Tax=Terrirubrum flagellatum TaxID=2895980 RepID=UPI0031454E85